MPIIFVGTALVQCNILPNYGVKSPVGHLSEVKKDANLQLVLELIVKSVADLSLSFLFILLIMATSPQFSELTLKAVRVIGVPSPIDGYLRVLAKRAGELGHTVRGNP